MDDRLRAIQREFIANPSEELAIQFMSLQCRLDPPGYSGKKISALKPHMRNVYGRLSSNLNEINLKQDDPIERLIALEITDLFSLYNFGFQSRITMLIGLVEEGVSIPDTWIRYLKKHEPYTCDQLERAIGKKNA